MPDKTSAMDLHEIIIAENIDEILRRSTLRLEQERIHVEELHEDSLQSRAAVAALTSSVASFDRLKAYRARLHQVERPSLRVVVSRTRQKEKAQ